MNRRLILKLAGAVALSAAFPTPQVEAQGYPSGPITFEIVDANGNTVRTMSMQAHGAGPVPFRWDGKTDGGDAAGAGRYTIRATAGNGDNVQQLAVAVEARVDSVSIGADGLVLNLAGLGSHPLSAIRRIG